MGGCFNKPLPKEYFPHATFAHVSPSIASNAYFKHGTIKLVISVSKPKTLSLVVSRAKGKNPYILLSLLTPVSKLESLNLYPLKKFEEPQVMFSRAHSRAVTALAIYGFRVGIEFGSFSRHPLRCSKGDAIKPLRPMRIFVCIFLARDKLFLGLSEESPQVIVARTLRNCSPQIKLGNCRE